MLPSRSGRSRVRAVAGFAFIFCLGSFAILSAFAQPGSPSPAPGKSPGSFQSIPLPVGQEAKGLILPDFDLQGKMRARFEAGLAKRIDANHIQFSGMKMTTFTPESSVDLLVEMPVSTLDLTTRVIVSNERANIQRHDFTISGDRLEFDTVARKGKLIGNVKMVINDQSGFMKKPEKPGE